MSITAQNIINMMKEKREADEKAFREASARPTIDPRYRSYLIAYTSCDGGETEYREIAEKASAVEDTDWSESFHHLFGEEDAEGTDWSESFHHLFGEGEEENDLGGLTPTTYYLFSCPTADRNRPRYFRTSCTKPELLGEGAHSKVYSVVEIDPKTGRALKPREGVEFVVKIPKTKALRQGSITPQSVQDEAGLLRTQGALPAYAPGTNFFSLDSTRDASSWSALDWPILFVRRLPGTSLADYMKTDAFRSLDFSQRIALIYNLMACLSNLHRDGLHPQGIHRDIKPENIRVASFAENGRLCHKIWIIDYGVSIRREALPIKPSAPEDPVYLDRVCVYGPKGSPFFMAPEVLPTPSLDSTQLGTASTAVDIYACVPVISETLYHPGVLADKKAAARRLSAGATPDILDTIPVPFTLQGFLENTELMTGIPREDRTAVAAALKHTLNKMALANPNERPSADDVLALMVQIDNLCLMTRLLEADTEAPVSDSENEGAASSTDADTRSGSASDGADDTAENQSVSSVNQRANPTPLTDDERNYIEAARRAAIAKIKATLPPLAVRATQAEPASAPQVQATTLARQGIFRSRATQNSATAKTAVCPTEVCGYSLEAYPEALQILARTLHREIRDLREAAKDIFSVGMRRKASDLEIALQEVLEHFSKTTLSGEALLNAVLDHPIVFDRQVSHRDQTPAEETLSLRAILRQHRIGPPSRKTDTTAWRNLCSALDIPTDSAARNCSAGGARI